jgi:hypothetical protein
MGACLAEVLRTFGPAYLRDHSLSTPQARAWRAIVACRTPALGGKLQRCDQCGREQRLFRSCRRACTASGERRSAASWISPRSLMRGSASAWRSSAVDFCGSTV